MEPKTGVAGHSSFISSAYSTFTFFIATTFYSKSTDLATWSDSWTALAVYLLFFSFFLKDQPSGSISSGGSSKATWFYAFLDSYGNLSNSSRIF